MTSSREPCDRCPRLQTTIDRLAAELAAERAEHHATVDERDRWMRRAAAWRRVARWIHQAHQENP